MGRFREPPDPVFHALNASISFDRRLGLYDVRQSQAHVAMLAEAGILTRRRVRRAAGRARPDRVRARGGALRVPSRRRGHPHGDRAPPHRDRGPGRGQGAHGALAQRPGRDRHGAVRARPGDGGAHEAPRPDAGAGRARRPPCRLADAGLHAPPARAARLPRAPSAGLLLDVPPRPRALRERGVRDRRPAARRGRARGRELGHAPHVGRARPRLRRRRRELARRGLQPRLRARLPERRGDLRHAPLAARRGDRAVVERGVRLPARSATPTRRVRA